MAIFLPALSAAATRVEFGVGRPHHRRGAVDGEGRLVGRRRLGDVGRQDQHGDAAPRQRRLRRHRRHAPRRGRRADLLAEHRAGRVDRLEIDLLRKLEAELVAHDLAGDQHDRRAVAVGLVEAVDEMQAAGPAGAGAERQFAGQQRVGAGGEAAGLLVAHMDEADVAAPDRVGDIVQRVAGHAVAAARAGLPRKVSTMTSPTVFAMRRSPCKARPDPNPRGAGRFLDARKLD